MGKGEGRGTFNSFSDVLMGGGGGRSGGLNFTSQGQFPHA